MKNSIFDTIDRTPIFNDLSKDEKLRLAEVADKKKYKKNKQYFLLNKRKMLTYIGEHFYEA